MERLRGRIRGRWERFLDGVVYIMQSPYLPYSEVEAGGIPPRRGEVPKEREPVVEEKPEQISE